MKDEVFLILTKEWFNKILSGEKKEEYRAYSDFYVSKFCDFDKKEKQITGIKKFKTVRFQLGYSKNAPQMVVAIKEFYCEGEANENQVLIPEKSQFVIVLGDILEKINV